MTRKDYVLLAAALLRSKPDSSSTYMEQDQWERDVKSVADALAGDNARFERQRFIDAAGVQ